MLKYQVRNPEQACTYLMDCIMATIDDVAMTKSRTKSYYQTQLKFTQNVIDSMGLLSIPVLHTRAEKVNKDHNGSVLLYAQSIEQHYGVKPFKSIDLESEKPFTSLLELLCAHREHALLSSQMAKSKHEKERQTEIQQFAHDWVQHLENK